MKFDEPNKQIALNISASKTAFKDMYFDVVNDPPSFKSKIEGDLSKKKYEPIKECKIKETSKAEVVEVDKSKFTKY